MSSHKKKREDPAQQEFWSWQPDSRCFGLYGQGLGNSSGEEKFLDALEKKLDKQDAKRRELILDLPNVSGKSVNLKRRYVRPIDKCSDIPVFPLAFIHWEGEDRGPDQK